MYYTYQGRRLYISEHAEIPRGLWPSHEDAKFVQQLLDSIEPWQGKSRIKTGRFEGLWEWPTALPIRPDGQRFWGIHQTHKADDPQLSPFVRLENVLPIDPETRQSITIELIGRPRRPTLTRLVYGRRTPPVPWMRSAERWEGGVAACVNFWCNHGYLSNKFTVVPGTLTDEPPEWFTS